MLQHGHVWLPMKPSDNVTADRGGRMNCVQRATLSGQIQLNAAKLYKQLTVKNTVYKSVYKNGYDNFLT